MQNLNNIKFQWYRAIVPIKKWNEFYSTTGNYTFLKGNDKQIEIGFLSTTLPENCLEITDTDDLLKIQRHREVTNHYPMPFEKIIK